MIKTIFIYQSSLIFRCSQNSLCKKKSLYGRGSSIAIFREIAKVLNLYHILCCFSFQNNTEKVFEFIIASNECIVYHDYLTKE